MRIHHQTKLEIELLALDLSVCDRCVGSFNNLEKAIETLRPVLAALNVDASVASSLITTEAKAQQANFAISPTLRINGRDIAIEAKEGACDTCTDLCNCPEGTTCRLWPYRGETFTEAPVGLIIESVLRELVDRANTDRELAGFVVPENLQRFFRAKLSNDQSCCSPEEREVCCDPEEKAECCDDSEPQTCAC